MPDHYQRNRAFGMPRAHGGQDGLEELLRKLPPERAPLPKPVPAPAPAPVPVKPTGTGEAVGVGQGAAKVIRNRNEGLEAVTEELRRQDAIRKHNSGRK